METKVVASAKNQEENIFYSQIISPDDYNRIISEEHLYIGASDQFISAFITNEINNQTTKEVIELGCGPGRLLPLMSQIPHINYTAIDCDPVFLEHAKKLTTLDSMKFVYADVKTYRHHKPVDIFLSQGMHHHINKGIATKTYLNNVYSQLKPGGYYILSDEFIPDYFNENDRAVNLVIWYSHIIAHALKDGYIYLAQEEAKTLLDDLHTGSYTTGLKTQEQINLVLQSVTLINEEAEKNNLQRAKLSAQLLITEINAMLNISPSGDNSIDLSRGDYKICDRVFREEISNTDFIIESTKFFGLKYIGGMGIYFLRKTE